MSWNKHPDYTNVFIYEKIFNKYTYRIEVQVEQYAKTVRFWISLSSGKKRKELSVFEDKPNKSLGGIKALIWAKKEILNFPYWYTRSYITEDKKCFICIGWEDSRRRNIYERLKKEGFYFMNIDKCKTLIKEIEYVDSN